MAPRNLPRDENGSVYSRPSDATVATLLGREFHVDGVSFTRDQMKALKRYYNFDPAYLDNQIKRLREAHERAMEAHMEKHREWVNKGSFGRKPKAPKRFDEASVRHFHESGSNRNLSRYIKRDGMRVMALLAQYLEDDEDPVRFVEGLLVEVGYDAAHGGWKEDEEEMEE